MKPAFLAIKYLPDMGNRSLIEALTAVLQQASWQALVIVRDVEDWGAKSFSPQELMAQSELAIRKSQVIFVEASQKGVGVGIEAGMAHALGIPVVVLAKTGTKVSPGLLGIAQEVLYYSQVSDLLPGILNLQFDL